jgi:dihydroneopterin aldolase
MITSSEKNLLKNLIQSPGFRIVENVAKELIEQVKDQSNLRETEWETAKNVALEEGQIGGIRKLLQELYRLAQDA